MKVEVEAKPKGLGLNGGPEVWVHVLANEVHDWPSIEAKLSGPQRVILNALGAKRTLSYFPHTPSPDEREEHGYMVDEWFVWSGR